MRGAKKKFEKYESWKNSTMEKLHQISFRQFVYNFLLWKNFFVRITLSHGP